MLRRSPSSTRLYLQTLEDRCNPSTLDPFASGALTAPPSSDPAADYSLTADGTDSTTARPTSQGGDGGGDIIVFDIVDSVHSANARPTSDGGIRLVLRAPPVPPVGAQVDYFLKIYSDSVDVTVTAPTGEMDLAARSGDEAQASTASGGGGGAGKVSMRDFPFTKSILAGDLGNDWIVGGTGRDEVAGGAGLDGIFVGGIGRDASDDEPTLRSSTAAGAGAGKVQMNDYFLLAQSSADDLDLAAADDSTGIITTIPIKVKHNV
jgi:hypothetical protein